MTWAHLLALADRLVTSPAVGLAQSVPQEFGPWWTVVNLGVSGVMLWAFATDKIAPTKERDKLRDELRQRNKEDRDFMIPALVRNTEVLTRLLERQAGSE